MCMLHRMGLRSVVIHELASGELISDVPQYTWVTGDGGWAAKTCLCSDCISNQIIWFILTL